MSWSKLAHTIRLNASSRRSQWRRVCHSHDKVVLSLVYGSCWFSELYPLTVTFTFPEPELFLQGQAWKILSRKKGWEVLAGVGVKGGENSLNELHCDCFWQRSGKEGSANTSKVFLVPLCRARLWHWHPEDHPDGKGPTLRDGADRSPVQVHLHGHLPVHRDNKEKAGGYSGEKMGFPILGIEAVCSVSPESRCSIS